MRALRGLGLRPLGGGPAPQGPACPARSCSPDRCRPRGPSVTVSQWLKDMGSCRCEAASVACPVSRTGTLSRDALQCLIQKCGVGGKVVLRGAEGHRGAQVGH